MYTWLKLIRWPNLLMIFIFQLSCFYFIIYSSTSNYTPPSIFNIWFNQIILSSFCIMVAAAGYIINDIFDQRLDWANREFHQLIVGNQLSLSKVKTAFVFFTISGFILALILSINIDCILAFGICPIIYSLLYFYSSHLKCTILTGNILVSVLTGLVMILPFYLNSIWIIELNGIEDYLFVSIQKTFFALAIFAFLINLIREIVKDQEDRMGDELCGCRTTAVGLGKKRTRALIIFLMALGFLLQVIFIYYDPIFHLWSWMVCVALPLAINILYYLLNHQQKFYHTFSFLLKINMFLGLFYFIFRHYANNIY